MKKIFSILLAVCLLPVGSMQVLAEHEGTVVVDESFENYLIGAKPSDEWVFDMYNKATGCIGEIAQDPHDPKNKAFRFTRGETTSLFWIANTFEPIGGQITITYKAMQTDPERTGFLGYLTTGHNIQVYGEKWNWSGAGVANIPCKTNVWYDLKWYVDLVEHKYEGYIDGQKVVTMELPPELDKISEFKFGMNVVDTWVDDLKISYVGGIVTSYTKLTVDEKFAFYNRDFKGIYNVPVDTTPAEFLSKCEFVEGAIVSVCDSDGQTPWTKKYLNDDATLRIQSPDFTQDLVLDINIRPWVASVSTVKKAYRSIVMYEGDADMLVKNQRQPIDASIDVKPYIKNDKLYVPLRALAEALGYSVGWDAATGNVTVGGTKVTCPIEKALGRSFVTADDAASLVNRKLLINEQGIAVFAPLDIDVDGQDYRVFLDEIAKRTRREKGVESKV